MRFTLFFCCLVGALYAQNQENIWYFGSRAGVNFNTSPPTVLSDGRMSTVEGSASIADSAGNLLFYTNGLRVYRRDHTLMANGDFISGSMFILSTTQAALIVPRPNNPNLYYIFSLEQLQAPLYLATVDMSQDGGFGRVTSKQTLLEDPASERLAGVYHANGRDIWVITHGYQNDSFNVYLVSPSGLAPPLRQRVGSVHSRAVLSEIGYLKTSHDGRKLALAVEQDKYLELFDFDPSTGRISNPIRINSIGSYGPYGLEFSPNNRFLYVLEDFAPGSGSRLIQYNLKAPNIPGSRTLIRQNTNKYGALQLANDQRIYYARVNNTNLGVIKNPNALATNLQIDDTEIDLTPGISNFGLPNFVRGLTSTVQMSDICVNRPSRFELTGALGINTAVWNFGDGSPPVNALTPQHTYSKKGLYTVTVNVAYRNGQNKTLSQVIEIDSITTIPTLAPLPGVCLTDSPLILRQGRPSGGTYSGRGVNSVSGTFNPALAGVGTIPITYTHTNINGCSASATANISVRAITKILSFSKSTPASGCPPVTLTFTNTSPSGSNFAWDAGDGSPLIRTRNLAHTYTKTGTYTVRLTADCASPITDVVAVRGGNFRRQNDTTICIGEKAPLQVGGAVSYVWSPATGLSATNIPNPIAAPTTTTTYNVQMTNAAGCIGFDTVTVTVLPKIILDLKLEMTNTCDSIQNVSISDRTAAVPPLNFEYTWTKADGGQVKTSDFKTINFDRTGTLNIRLKPGGRCIDDTSINLKVDLSKKYLAFNSTNVIQAKALGCDANDPIQLEANGGETYTWTPAAGLSNPKIANPIAAVNSSTTYTVKIRNAAGCIVERSISIRVPQIPNFNLKIEKTRENCNTTPKVEFGNQSAGLESYNWEFGDGGRSTEAQPTHYYQEGGNYQVKLRITTPDKCIRDTSFQVAVDAPIAYNAFSPNGDNINDVFDIGLVGWGIEIYNRWGKLVYKREDYQNDWTGDAVTAGTYYYTLTSPTGQTCRGWVSLLK